MASIDEVPSPSSQESTIQSQSQTPAESEEEEEAWSSSFIARSHSSSTPRSRPASPRVFSSLSSPSGLRWERLVSVFGSFWDAESRHQQQRLKRRRRRRSRSLAVWIGVVGFFVLMNWWMFSRLQNSSVRPVTKISTRVAANSTASDILQGDWINYEKGRRPRRLMYTRLLALAAHALAEAESRPEPRDTWKESLISASSWVPCADRRSWKFGEGNNGYILVSANGGISQQRVAICNAVAISRLLNSTLVLPKFLHSSVWKDARRII